MSTADGDCSHEIKRRLLLGRKAMTNLDSMYGCESWTIKKAEGQRIDAFELWGWRRFLDCKEIKPVNPKGNQSWIFIGRTDAEAETPILRPPDVKDWLLGKDPDAGKDWRQEEKGMTEDEMIGWHYWLDGHAFEQALGVGSGQGNLACCSPWGCKELDPTEQLNWLIGLSLLSSKEQASFNFVDAVTIHNDFGAQENKICHYFHFPPIYLPWSNRTVGLPLWLSW